MSDLDLETARRVVLEREREQIDSLVNDRERLVLEEANRQEHARVMAEAGRALIAGQERNKQLRSQQHAAARDQARQALDVLKAATKTREAAADRAGAAKAHLEEIQKQLARHAPLDPDEYPSTEEVEAWKERHRQLVDASRRIQAESASRQTELAAALAAENQAIDKLREVGSIELRLREQL
jgi:hypothetical protein